MKVLLAGATAAPLVGATMSRVRQLVKSNSGNVAVIFALLLVPLFAGLGAAVDFSRGFLVQRQLSGAIDAAALAVGASTAQDPAVLGELAQNYFDANYKPGGVGDAGTVSLNINNSVISISASTTVPTIILGLVGYDVLDVVASAEIVKDSKSLEIAMVL
ncbi:MAG: TadE/TadG family type IV pilus assembly protein [Alphaproteobacteria bacterium]